MRGTTNSPQSVTRVIRIIEALCASPEPLGLAQISRLLDAPKSSIAALLRGLADSNFVVATDGRYRLGIAAFGLGSALLGARREFSSSDLIRDGMRRLAQQTGETVLFAVRDSDDHTLTYVDIIESQNAVRFAVSIGDRRPLYCTSAGRALLATVPDKTLKQYFARLRPQRLTARTETDKRALAEEIGKIRETGFAQTVDQTSDGVTGTAAVIRDASGEVLGALVVAAPSARLHGSATERVAQRVLKEADAVSRTLGYRG